VFYEKSLKLREKRLEAIEGIAKYEQIKGRRLAIIELDKIFSGYGYPLPGRSVGLLYDKLKPGSVLGFANNYVIIRGELPGFDIHTLISRLQKELPLAQIDGGGHSVAGTLSFLPGFKTEVKNQILALLGL